MLIPLITILGSVAIAVAVSWYVTYYTQREKLHKVKAQSLNRIRLEREHCFNKGFDTGVAHEKKVHAKALEEQYLNGYNDGQGNERDMVPSTGKHGYNSGSHITAMYPNYKNSVAQMPVVDGIEGIEKLIGDEDTAVWLAANPAA